jgi:hypothetical protein
LLGDFQVNDVAQVNIKQGGTELNLAKKEDLWRVRERGDYAANFSQITDLLLKLRDLKIVQTEKIGASQLPRLELNTGAGSNTATVVELRDTSGKALKTLLLGKKHMKKSGRPSPFGGDDEGWPDGRYVMAGASSDTVALISEPLENAKPAADSWLDKDFFKVEKVKSVAVTFPAATNSWKMTRETENGEMKLADAKPEEKLDAGKSSSVANPMSSPSFVDVVIGADDAKTGFNKPTVIAIETFDNLNYTCKVGAKDGENYYFAMAVDGSLPKERTPGKDEKPEDKDKLEKEFKDQQKKLEEKLMHEKTFSKWTYLVSGWTVDSLLKERGQLLEEKKADEKKPEDKPAAADGDNKGIPLGELPK